MDLVRCGMETQPSGREPSGIHPRRSSRTAGDLLRKHERLSKTVVAFPVPIEAIVERTLGLRVVSLPIEALPCDIILARIDPDDHGRPATQMNETRTAYFE
jgi:hypothetical protein